MRRRLFSLASLLSLLLCVATVVLWVRKADKCEIHRRTCVEGTSTYCRAAIYSHWGEVEVQVCILHATDSSLATYFAVPPSEIESVVWKSHLMHQGFQVGRDETVWGFSFIHRLYSADSGKAPVKYWNIIFPHWAIFVALALIPSIWLIYYLLVIGSRKIGHCPACSYNLTGNISGVCPECGTPVPATLRH